MTAAWWYVGIAIAAAALALAWPLTAALPTSQATPARVAVAVLAALICVAAARLPRLRAGAWLTLAAVCGCVAIGLLLAHFEAANACVAEYDGQPRIVGREYTSDVGPYIAANPGLSASDRLLDAGGIAERVWTTESIQRCRFWVSWGGLLVVPLFAASAAALVAGAGRRPLRAARSEAGTERPRVTPTTRYDAFLSYRHIEPDRQLAFEILEFLERHGLRVAIDVRDFAANEHFISEMERCIKESRFVLCVITARYVESVHTSEEAIISKTLDLAERRRRLVPLIVEPVELPVWLHGLVGIDFTPSAHVDPLERLKGLLKTC
jgi:hypothetical protein